VGVLTFGLLALYYPGEHMHTLMLPFGILLAVNGGVMLAKNIRFMAGTNRWGKAMFRIGMVEFLIGATAIWFAVTSVRAVWELTAVWAIFTGSIQTDRFRRLKSRMSAWKVMVASGIMAVAFGVFIIFNLKVEIVSFTYEAAVFALILGSSMIYTFFRLGAMRKYLRNKPKKMYSRKTTVYYDRTY
jgi:uncharacterized membrane protein HdeD (DUF308 family)